MIEVVLFGTGNVATHLFEAFRQTNKIRVIQIYNHHPDSLRSFQSVVDTTTSFTHLKKADLYLLAIKDDQVEQTLTRLRDQSALIAHTSGSLPLLKNTPRSGVFYPLQTFSKSKTVDFSTIPIAIEAAQPADVKILFRIGRAISKKVYKINTEQRKTLHLAAVFACNFTNALYGIAEDLCLRNELPFDILHPLIEETAQKIKRHSPKTVQTGPAIRDDQKTINLQLSALNETPQLKEIYTLFTSLIQHSMKEENYKLTLKNITTFIFDIDGVLTNSQLIVTTDGHFLRSMNVRDGYAFRHAIDAGYRICIISGGKNEGVRKRLQALGVKDIFLGIDDKVKQLNAILKKYEIDPKNVAYMGDDIPDTFPMRKVGLPTCPQDAEPEVKTISSYISHRNGGSGCARDLIKQVMKIQNKWEL